MANILNKIKKIYICIVIVIVLILVLGVIFAIIFLLHAVGILTDEDMASFTQSSSSNSYSVTDPDLQELMAMSDEEVWELLTGTKFSEKPTSSQVSESTMSARMTTITVPVRTASGDSQTSVTVNQALASLFTAFYTDLYNNCPDFYVINDGGYNYRTVRGSSSGALSAHAFGAAVDINAEYNPQGTTPLTLAEYSKVTSAKKHYLIYYDSDMVKIAYSYTLAWGGDFKTNKDGMHFSFIGDYSRSYILSNFAS